MNTLMLLFPLFMVVNAFLDILYFPGETLYRNYKVLGKLDKLTAYDSPTRFRVFLLCMSFMTTIVYILALSSLSKEEKELRKRLSKSLLPELTCRAEYSAVYKK